MTPTAAPDRPGPWALYDALIDGVPDGIGVTAAIVNNWAAVATDIGTAGVAMTYPGGPDVDPALWDVIGADLRTVAAYARSWNLRLASLGVAALNAWYATPDRIAAVPGTRRGPDANFFHRYRPPADGGRTAFVGHFSDIDALPRERIDVLERSPRGADLPDTAAEFVLPDARVVVITGSTVVNKTLPRLLALSHAARVHIVGPTAPPAPGCYPPCVREICGSVVVDPEAALRHVGLGLRHLVGEEAMEMFAMPVGSTSAAQDHPTPHPFREEHP